MIDNHSHDGSAYVAEAMTGVRLVRNGTNRYLSPAWNQGARLTLRHRASSIACSFVRDHDRWPCVRPWWMKNSLRLGSRRTHPLRKKPGSEVVEFDTGHWVMSNAPERFNRVVADWLAR